MHTCMMTPFLFMSLTGFFPLNEPQDQREKGWSVSTPIVTYWAGPEMTDANAQQLKEGGWNLVWCREKELDVAQRHGLRAQLSDPLLSPSSLDDPVRLAALESLIGRVRNHPVLYSYFMEDEPTTGRFGDLGRLVAFLKKRDPAHLAYINLFPTYASNEQLGNKGDTVGAYREHLKQFVDVVKPAMIRYDHYQFAIKSDMPDYFLNLALIREASLQAGLLFLNIVQACSWTPSMREPNENEMRYLVHTTLAYGARGISYYVYSHPGHSPGIATLDGKPTRVYDWLKRLNREFVAVATELQELQSTGVYHEGMLPPGTLPLPEKSPFVLDPVIPATEFKRNEPTKGVLLGFFGKPAKRSASPTHVYIVNLDYQSEKSFTLRGPSALETFDATTLKWASLRANTVRLQLAPGGGVLVRTRR